MIRNWLFWINISLLGTIILQIVFCFGFYFSRPSDILTGEMPQKKAVLPKGAFTMTKKEYDTIGPPFIQLRFSPMSLQLPNLRNYLVYYGRNERPDADPKKSMLHFAFMGTKAITSIPPGHPLYLVYDKDQPRIKYLFNPNNKETSLWIKATAKDKEALVDMAMKNEMGEIIRKPQEYATFKLRRKEFTRFGIEKWELGKWRVDGTLLARQRARWYGRDVFLTYHGGEEYKELIDKERIDFGEGENAYSVYMGVGDTVAWIDSHWKQIQPGDESRQLPLMVINKVDERLMKLNLWNVEGITKISLNLIRSKETAIPQNIEQTFKFVGARTRTQLMFEINDERVLLRPQDWLLFTDGEWKKLVTPEEIDAYVERKTVGPLFVIDGARNEEGRQILSGELYNSTRTEMKEIVIPLLQRSTSHSPQTHQRYSQEMEKEKK